MPEHARGGSGPLQVRISVNFLHACILPSADVHVSLKTLCSASGAASSTTASLFMAMGRVLTRRVFMRWSSTVSQPVMWAVAR